MIALDRSIRVVVSVKRHLEGNGVWKWRGCKYDA